MASMKGSWILRPLLLLLAFAVSAAGCAGQKPLLVEGPNGPDEERVVGESSGYDDYADEDEAEGLALDDDPMFVLLRDGGAFWVFDGESCTPWWIRTFDNDPMTGDLSRTWATDEGVIETCGYTYEYSRNELVLLGPSGRRQFPDGEVESWGMGSMGMVSVEIGPEGILVGGDPWHDTKEGCEAHLVQLAEEAQEQGEEIEFYSTLGCAIPE